ncbi:MAG: 1-deoxy-D-xylulose-5-phosphate reductoisomerase [Succinivibrionaceae bacterium]|nr:1-deoxy-D-xylulose-5-phosphate reductoisomerase [Succinivibrionaceae bacterium]
MASPASPLAIALLGATGSIGSSTLDVIARNPDRYTLHSAVAGANDARMLEVVREFSPRRVAMRDEAAARRLRERVAAEGLRTEILSGEAGVLEVAGDGEAGYTVSAIVGAAGLRPTLAALHEGATIGLANKESLVMTGRIFFRELSRHHARVLPIDSEHSAIFECLPAAAQQSLGSCDLKAAGVHRILLTGSGGPFRDTPLADLCRVTPQMAVAHPVWSMGPKISVDSATMMNKGLEFVEARYLFNARREDIEIVIHPQSVVHSMVSYRDGALLAMLGRPDMRVPIARALAYPDRVAGGVEPLDPMALNGLSFAPPDFRRYPCLGLMMEASARGQGATTVANAANEVANAAFLAGRLPFTAIADTVSHALEGLGAEDPQDLDGVLDLDARARELAGGFVAAREGR